MKSIILLTALSLTINTVVFAQSTCNDPKAKNYQKEGTCEYKKTKLKAKKKMKLEEQIAENSGLIHINGGYLTHNDSGSENELYFLDKETGQVLKVIKVTNAQNKDWEDIAQDDTHIYVGDFGNNVGSRTDLAIYKIRKDGIAWKSDKKELEVTAEIIRFDYENRPKNLVKYQHDYDCEAFTFYEGQLHLFTKNWGNRKTYHYILPNEAGKHTATLQDSLDVKGLVTAADISEDGQQLLLLGYTKKGKVFVWWCHNFGADGFFSGENRRFEIGNMLFKGQAEGITFVTSNEAVYSAERIKMWKPRIFQLNLEKYGNDMKVKN